MLNLLEHYDGELGGVDADQFDGDSICPDEEEILSHARWMVKQAMKFDDQEKQQRWLGCVQGLLFAAGERSINQLREETKLAKAGTI